MAELMGNEVLAQMLGDLISRCALITLMYQSASAAEHSHDEHAEIVKAPGRQSDEERRRALMHQHLQHVEESLTFDRKQPSNDISTSPCPDPMPTP
jgi:DNA-binding GntR family transcriptional regulator